MSAPLLIPKTQENLATGGGQWRKTEEEYHYLLLVMQTLIVVLEYGRAFCLAGIVFGVGVCDVAGEDFLPEGEAAGGPYTAVVLAVIEEERERVVWKVYNEGRGL